MFHVKQITDESLRHVLENLSDDDRAELAACGLQDAALSVFEYGWHTALDSGCIHFGEEPVAVFGACPAREDPSIAVVWMVATDRFTEQPQAMARLSRKVIARWRRRFRLLTNLVHREHARAIKWLRWLGFEIEPVAIGPRQAFYAFRLGGSRV